MIVELVSKISNLCDPDPPTLQTDRRTDGRTTCNLNTALCTSASHGKKEIFFSAEGARPPSDPTAAGEGYSPPRPHPFSTSAAAVASCPWGQAARAPKYFEKMKKFHYFGVESILHRFSSGVIYRPHPRQVHQGGIIFLLIIGWSEQPYNRCHGTARSAR